MKLLNECQIAYELELIKLKQTEQKFIKTNNLIATKLSATAALKETCLDVELEKNKYLDLLVQNDILSQDVLETSIIVNQTEIVDKKQIQQLNKIQNGISIISSIPQSVINYYKLQEKNLTNKNDDHLSLLETENQIKQIHLQAILDSQKNKQEHFNSLLQQQKDIGLDSELFQLEQQHAQLSKQNYILKSQLKIRQNIKSQPLEQKQHFYLSQLSLDCDAIKQDTNKIENRINALIHQFVEIVPKAYSNQNLQQQLKIMLAIRNSLNINIDNDFVSIKNSLHDQVTQQLTILIGKDQILKINEDRIKELTE